MEEYYREDLAFIHDAGFRGFALNAAPGVLEILARHQIREGLVVDLGCGSGLWAQALARAHYRVLGIDLSEAMIALARQRVPEAEFRVASLFQAELPPCQAVTSLGECLNYLFDAGDDRQRLGRLFRRVYRALTPGGVFVFDIAEPGQVKAGTSSKGFSEGAGWVVLAEKQEDHRRRTLTRRIISFRQAGKHYRRTDETHQVRLYSAAEVARELRRAGFRARTLRRYGRYELPRAQAAFVARKPA
jgi:SAM-dependent methyltransferase